MEFFRSGFIIIIGFFSKPTCSSCFLYGKGFDYCRYLSYYKPCYLDLHTHLSFYTYNVSVDVHWYSSGVCFIIYHAIWTCMHIWLLYPECSGWHILQLSSSVHFYYKPCYLNCILIMAFIPTILQSIYSPTHFRYLSYYMPCYLDPHAHLGFYTHNVSVDVHTDLQVSVSLYALLFRLACSSYLLYSQCFSHWKLRPSSYSIIFL